MRTQAPRVAGRLARYSSYAIAAVLLGPTMALHAQDRRPDQEPPAEERPTLPTPSQAFLRSLLLPGLGQAPFDAFFRGGVYFAGNSVSWYMLLKSHARYGQALDVERRRLAAIEIDMRAAGIEDAALIAQAQEEDPLVRGTRNLLRSRRQQREDWIAATLFWTLAGALDAYVTAHLHGFPARITGTASPDGGLGIGVTLKLDRKH